MTPRQLVAYINLTRVGTLEDHNGIWRFQYAPDWRAFALSPSLPIQDAPHIDNSSDRPVQWYFDNLLPEEGQRLLLAKEAHLHQADAFGLLSYYGAESAGSITLLPPAQSPPSEEGMRALPDDQLEERIRQLPRVSLAQGSTKRMSLAGAQHKLAVILRDDGLHEPIGHTPSTHILKPEHTDTDYTQSVINEWFVMTLAQRVGLNVPTVYRRYVPSPVYLIDRFDRHEGQRLHTIDACQLLDIDRAYKYIEGSIDTLARLAKRTRSPAVTTRDLFCWLVFNLLVGNNDAHLKNISFLVGSDGIRLAPFYDLLSTAYYETRAAGKDAWPTQTRLAWPILGIQFFSDITRELLIQAANDMGINRVTAVRLLDDLRQKTVKEADLLYAEAEAENLRLFALHDAFKPKSAGELRVIKAIQLVIIQTMSDQLAN